jgi:hypothetical protein
MAKHVFSCLIFIEPPFLTLHLRVMKPKITSKAPEYALISPFPHGTCLDQNRQNPSRNCLPFAAMGLDWALTWQL